MNAIWGAGLLSLSKLIVVVDADCDVHDYAEVAWRAFGNVDYAHDVLHTVGPVDHLDHASYEQFFGGKLGIDATRKLPTEGYRRDGGWPTECVLDQATQDLVDRRWREYGIERRGRRANGRRLSADRARQLARTRHAGPREPGAQVPVAGDDRALGVRAAVRLHRRADRDVDADALGALGAAGADHGRDGVGPHGRDERQPDPRPQLRRAEPAHRPARAGDRRAVASARAWVGTAVALVVFLGSARRCRRCAWRWRRSRWSCSSCTPTASGSPTTRRRCSRSRSSSRRSAPGSRVTGRASLGRDRAGRRGRHVDRRLRPHLLLPGRRGRPRIGVRSVPARFGIAAALRASSVVHVVTVAAFVWFGAAAGLGWLWCVGVALTAAVLVYEHASSRPTTCRGSTGRSSPPTASSASACSRSRSPT